MDVNPRGTVHKESSNCSNQGSIGPGGGVTVNNITTVETISVNRDAINTGRIITDVIEGFLTGSCNCPEFGEIIRTSPQCNGGFVLPGAGGVLDVDPGSRRAWIRVGRAICKTTEGGGGVDGQEGVGVLAGRL